MNIFFVHRAQCIPITTIRVIWCINLSYFLLNFCIFSVGRISNLHTVTWCDSTPASVISAQ